MDQCTFEQQLNSARKILILSGAGITLPSGFPGLRTVCKGAMDIVTREAWDSDPAAVWEYYTARRRQAKEAKPNKAHKAIAKLAQKRPDQSLLVVSHTVDDLYQRAGFPPHQLISIFGTIYNVKCTYFKCSYSAEIRADPLVPALEKSVFEDYYYIPMSQLPKCPKCDHILRPNCVWWGDPMSHTDLQRTEAFINTNEVDLVIIVGMSGTVWPSAGYVDEVKSRGGKVAVFNIDPKTEQADSWFFQGEVTETIPSALKSYF